ncbi:MAG: 3-hydroxyacyl-ACP dehydratase FabZ [Dethiobacteria bacterium]
MTELSINEILGLIQHRYPFVLVDRIIEIVPGERAVGLKNVTMNEPFFQGHFPGDPIMPGVLQVEALAQVGAVALLAQPEYRNRLVLFAGIDKFRFREVVRPGDQLIMELEVLKMRGGAGKAQGKITVDDKVVADGQIMFAVMER